MTQREALTGRIGSFNKRIGCSFCFYTLDPDDYDVDRRGFVACANCHAAYHANCQKSSCINCGSMRFEPVEVVSPPPLNAHVRHPLVIKPVSINLSKERPKWDYVIDRARHELLIQIPIALLFIGIAGLLGSFAYRITQLVPITAQQVLDAVFRSELPSTSVIVASLLSASTFAYVFFPASTTKDKPLSFGQRLSRFIGCIMFLMVYNILFTNTRIDITLYSSIRSIFDNAAYQELIIVEFASLIIITLLAIIYRARIHPIIRPTKIPHFAERLGSFIDGLRFLTSMIFAAILVSLVAIVYNISSHLVILIDIFENGFTGNDQLVAITTTSAVVALAIYHSPVKRDSHSQSRILSRINLLIRVVGVLICLMVFVFLYQRTNDTQAIIEIALSTLIIGVLFLPIQRAFA